MNYRGFGVYYIILGLVIKWIVLKRIPFWKEKCLYGKLKYLKLP